MKEKSTLTKFIELAMSCQVKRTEEILAQIEKLPLTPELIKFRVNLNTEHQLFMNDCRAILRAEKLYLEMQSN